MLASAMDLLPEASDRGFRGHDGIESLKLPPRQVLPEVKQLAMPGDEPHLGRNVAILQGMSMDHLQAGVVLDRPAPVVGRTAERNFFVVKEEILVHPAQIGHHARS